MADEITKADIDKAVKAAVDAAKAEAADEVEKERAKNQGLLDDLKKAQRELRAAKDITPEAHQAEIERADKAESELNEVRAALKKAEGERDKAVKSLETEQGAARNYALENELNSAIAEANIVPSLVPGFRAMMMTQAKAEMADGKYVVTIGDKPAKDHIKAFAESDEGKAWRAASINSGGGAPGSGGGKGGAQRISSQQYNETISGGDINAIKSMNEGIRDKTIVVSDEAA